MDGVQVHRYRYAPRRLETLVHDGGMLSNLRRHRWKWLLVPGFLAGLALALRRIERQWHPDVIHAHWLLPQGLVAALRPARRRKAVPFVVTSHGADLYALRSAIFRRLKRLVLARAAGVTVVSNAMVDKVLELHAGSKPVRVQPMGVDFEGRFFPEPTVERRPGQLLFVGRFVEKKGLRELLDALPTIVQARSDVHLTIVGFGPEEADRRRQVQALGIDAHVRFAGAISQSEIASFYRQASVLVAPFVPAASGDQEGLGLVMLEAAGCGCRVVAGDLPAVRDVADGELIRTTTVGNPGGLASSVLDALRNADEARVGQARNALASRYDWSVVSERYAAFLQDAIRASGTDAEARIAGR
jgi:glycosyltransferase involved in cell wall biosynthesis